MVSRKTGSLDTNTLLRLVLGDISAQSQVVEELIADSTSLAVADIAVIEMVFVLEKVYKFTRSDVVASVTSVIRHPKINCNRKLFELALATYGEQAKLSIVDCALMHYASLNKSAPLYTFDTALAQSNPDIVYLLETTGS